MPSVAVIDQLIIKLGLDPRDFTKGEKQVAASVISTEQTVKKSSESMGRSITAFAGKWLTAAAIFSGIKKSVGILDDVAERTRRLGIDSKNYGIAANELRNFENAVEDVGGASEEARKTIGSFNKSIFDLVYNGQMSDSLVMLARLGVHFQDASGHAKDFTTVTLETADAIALAQQRGMSSAEAFQFLQQSGFDSGTSQLILQGRAAINQNLATQAARRQIGGADIDKATEIRRASISKDQSLEVNLGVNAMQALGGIQEGVNKFIDELSGPDGANKALAMLSDTAASLGDAFDDWTLRVSNQTRGMRNNNPLNLKTAPGQNDRMNHDRQNHRVFSTMEEGVLAANHQLDLNASRGQDTIDEIVDGWATDGKNNENYKQFLEQAVGVSRKKILDSYDRAALLAGMAHFESGNGTPDSGAMADILQSAAPTPGSQASGSSSRTDVSIGSMTINTQAKDADGIAGEVDSSLRRKVMAAHAEGGLR